MAHINHFDSQPENDFEKISATDEGFDQESDGLNAASADTNDPQDGEVSTTTENLHGSLLKGLDPRDSVEEEDISIPQFFVNLIYWRDVKKTGVVFGSLLVVLFSLAIFSLVSVLAYLSLAVLTITFSFVVYKKVMGAVQKSNEGHPFRSLLEMDVSLSEDKLKTVIQALLKNLNKTVSELRRLFLIEDLVDSIKFGLKLWILTYVGSLMNGMSIIVLDVILIFTLPKVYETYQVQIDNYVGLAKVQINKVLSIVQSKVPFIKKKDKAQ